MSDDTDDTDDTDDSDLKSRIEALEYIALIQSMGVDALFRKTNADVDSMMSNGLSILLEDNHDLDEKVKKHLREHADTLRNRRRQAKGE